MTSLRWLAWPSPRRSDGAAVVYAHAFKRGEELKPVFEALCGAALPNREASQRFAGRLPYFFVHPGDSIERCHFCDQACRDMGAPHPRPAASPEIYDPVHLFEEWANL